jgi:hypothetical protein
VTPEKKLAQVGVDSVRKKMKSAGFARNVNRDDIVNGAAELGVDLDEAHRVRAGRDAGHRLVRAGAVIAAFAFIGLEPRFEECRGETRGHVRVPSGLHGWPRTSPDDPGTSAAGKTPRAGHAVSWRSRCCTSNRLVEKNHVHLAGPLLPPRDD